MNDKIAIKYYNDNFINKRTLNWNSFKGVHKEYGDYIKSRFDDDISPLESIYRIINNINEAPKCPICGRKLKFKSYLFKYSIFCSRDCALSKEGTRISNIKNKQTKLERYGVDCNFKDKDLRKQYETVKLKKYGSVNNIEKCKRTKLERYGDEKYNNIEKCKQTKLERYGDEKYNNHEKCEQTCIERYSVNNGAKTAKSKEKQRKTFLKKYGVQYYVLTNEQKEKSYITKKKNKTFSSSSIEKLFEQYLIEHNIQYIYQYKSKKYPFNCDFYIPIIDLYLEIQGNWCHGDHPYNPEDKTDRDVVDLWRSRGTKYYKNAINTWTKRDPLKRLVAKENNLNYLEVFTYNINELIKKFEEIYEIQKNNEFENN